MQLKLHKEVNTTIDKWGNIPYFKRIPIKYNDIDISEDKNNNPIFNRDIEQPYYWDKNTANRCLPLPGWPVGTVCKSIRAFKNFLIEGSPVSKPNFSKATPLPNRNMSIPNTTIIKINIVPIIHVKVVIKLQKEKAGYITPVPGGVGPMTVATLLQNTLQAAETHD